MKFTCAQRGCKFEADAVPADCPVCNNPFLGGIGHTDGYLSDDEVPWTDYTVCELLGYCKSWGLEGFNTRTSKPDLIKLLEAAE